MKDPSAPCPTDHAIPGKVFHCGKSLALNCGRSLPSFQIAYQTWGRLNAKRDNAILVCHALSGDQFAGGTHPVTGRKGWWDAMIGPGKPLDSDRFFIICSNVLGGCMGSTGPGCINPKNGHKWKLSFPLITITDMVGAQRRLIDHLGIARLFCVIGGSMGGMQALQWAVDFPDRVFSVAAIATAARHSAQNISFHEIGRQAVVADPEWMDGHYADRDKSPRRGLAVARMVAHITYLSEAALHRKFGRDLQKRKSVSYGFDADFAVESYLRHQGSAFVDRFDANSYLYITRAMDYFDLASGHDSLAQALNACGSRFFVVSFSSDWLFPTSESRHLVRALNASGADVSFCEVETDKGHDAFLLDEPEFHAMLRGFLDGARRHL